VPDLNAGLVVLDLERMREGVRPVVLPGNAPRQHVLRALEPLEADQRGSRRFRAAERNGAPRKAVDQLAVHCRLLLHDPALLGGAIPRIGHLGIKQRRVEPVDNAPGVPAERQHLLALPQPLTARSDDDLPVNLVRRARRDRSDREAAYGAAGLRRQVADHVSEFLVIRPSAVGDAFLAIVGGEVFAEQPVDGAEARQPGGLRLTALALGVSLVEQSN